MGSWNFGREYLTDWSYETQFGDDYLYIVDEYGLDVFITEKIEKINNCEFSIVGNFTVYLYLDTVEVQSGYYDNLRFIPTISAELLYDGDSLTVCELEYTKDTTTYEEALNKFLKEELNTSTTPEMRNYFRKINNILLESLYPRTVGHCASTVTDAEAVQFMECED